MEQYLQFLENARKYAKTADHLLTNTFPLVKDPKMLLTVLNNVFMAYKHAMMFMLYRDVAQGKIPAFNDDTQTMLDIFRARSERRYSINPEYVRLLEETYSMVKEHKTSPLEFSRHEMYVICSDSYEMKKITTQNLREYISKAKLFIEEIAPQQAKHA